MNLAITPSRASQSLPLPVSGLHPRFQNDAGLAQVTAGNKALKIGDKSESVRKVQQALGDMGFYNGDRFDGSFGRMTATALRNFQSSRQLPATGRLDARTLASLNQTVPAVGFKLWDDPVQKQDAALIPDNKLADGRRARAVVDLSEHRLFLFEKDGMHLRKVFSIACGNPNLPDGKGIKSTTGVKMVVGKNGDPTAVANQLWPETHGRAFGTRLLDLSQQDPVTGKFKPSGVELHGTYARESIGLDASHGCMRMLNEDIEEVFDQLRAGDRILVQD